VRRGVVAGCGAWTVVLLLAFGIAVSASSLSGRWKTELALDIDAATFGERIFLRSELATEFRVGGWTFANVASCDSDIGLDIVKFAAAGFLGAFDVISSMTFNERGDDFRSVAAARTIIGGVDVWSGATLWGRDVDGYGPGVILGASGVAGNIEFYADITFNIDKSLVWHIIETGFDAFWDRLVLCDILGPACWNCDPTFSFLDVYTKIPWVCFDIETLALFTRSSGFQRCDVWISDVDLGFGGLMLNRFDVLFTVESKAVLLDFGLRLAETACITPYVSLVRDAPEDQGKVDGLLVDALELVWTLGDVTFIASELFDTGGLDPPLPGPLAPILLLGNDARIHKVDLFSGAFGECFVPVAANEAIGIEVRRAGCCGSTFRLGIYTFFDTHLPGTSLFDWSETRVRLEYGSASNLTVSGSLNVDHEQVTSLGIGIELFWGDLVIFGPDWEAACCRVGFI
jgi:hypothetical protein